MTTNPVLIAHAPEESRMGPAMSALTERQRAFVYNLLDSGGRNHTDCYLRAGYAVDQKAPRQNAWELFHTEKIQAAMHEVAVKRLQMGAVLAVSTVLDIAANPVHKDQFKASLAILDRVGLHATSEHKVVTERSSDEKQLIREILAESKRLGVDPRLLLGSDYVDADFEEVSSAEPAEIDWLNETGAKE